MIISSIINLALFYTLETLKLHETVKRLKQTLEIARNADTDTILECITQFF